MSLLDNLFFHRIWHNGSKVVDTFQPIEFKDGGGVSVSTVNGRTVIDLTAIGAGSGATSTDSIKEPVYVIAESPITLSGAQTISGVSVGVGKRVLVAAQGGGVTNGIYVVAAGVWSFAADWATVKSGCSIQIAAGNRAGATAVVSTADPITIGVSPVSFTLRPFNDLTGKDKVVAVVTSGELDFSKVGNDHIADNTVSPGKIASGGSGNNGKVLGVSGGVVTLIDSITTSTGGTVVTTATTATTIKTLTVANSTTFTFTGGCAVQSGSTRQTVRVTVTGSVNGSGVVTLDLPRIEYVDGYTLGVITFTTGTNSLIMQANAASVTSTSWAPYGSLATVN